MSSKTDIANMALAFIRVENILTDLDTDESYEGKTTRRFYQHCVDMVLEEYEWTFADRTEELGTSNDAPPTDWAYRYNYPDSCVKPHEIVNATRNEDRTAFKVELAADDNTPTILCDIDGACLRFTTSKFANPGKWPAHFVDAVTYKLAIKLAGALKNQSNVLVQAEQLYRSALWNARYVDETSHHLGKSQKPSGIRARS